MRIIYWAIICWTCILISCSGVWFITQRLIPNETWAGVVAVAIAFIFLGSILPCTLEDTGVALGVRGHLIKLSLACLKVAHWMYQVPCWGMKTTSAAAVGLAKIYLLQGEIGQASIWSARATGLAVKDNWRYQFKVKLLEGIVHFRKDEFAQAAPCLSESLEIHRKFIEGLKFAPMITELEENRVMALDFLALSCLRNGDIAGAKDAFAEAVLSRIKLDSSFSTMYFDYGRACILIAENEFEEATEKLFDAAEKIPSGQMQPFDENVALNVLQMLKSLGTDPALHQFHGVESKVARHFHGFARQNYLNESNYLAKIQQPCRSVSEPQHDWDSEIITISHANVIR